MVVYRLFKPYQNRMAEKLFYLLDFVLQYHLADSCQQFLSGKGENAHEASSCNSLQMKAVFFRERGKRAAGHVGSQERKAEWQKQ